MNAQCFTIVVLSVQLIAIVERQVFDFLGYMWTCIGFNFLQILFIIFALFGICQHRAKVISLYLIWSFLWIGWNIFIICQYLDIGVLHKTDVTVLNMGTGSQSWWMLHGSGCRPVNDAAAVMTTVSSSTAATTTTLAAGSSTTWPLLPSVTNPTTFLLSLTTPVAMGLAMSVTSTATLSPSGCILSYEYVEVLHAAIELALALLGIIGVCFVLNILRVRYNASQLVSGELEYIRMQHPSSLDRRTVPTPANHPHQIYDVPRAGRPIAGGDSSSVKSGRRTPSSDHHSSRGSGRRPRVVDPSPPEAEDLGAIAPSRPSPVRVPVADEVPYAVSGMAMRLPPAGRRTHDGSRPPAYIPPQQPVGFGSQPGPYQGLQGPGSYPGGYPGAQSSAPLARNMPHQHVGYNPPPAGGDLVFSLPQQQQPRQQHQQHGGIVFSGGTQLPEATFI